MTKAQFCCMKVVARVARQSTRIRQGQTARAIQRIANQRVARGCQVDPDLVRPACRNTHLTQEGIFGTFDDGHVRQGGLAFLGRGMDRTEQGVRHRADGRGDRYLVPIGTSRLQARGRVCRPRLPTTAASILSGQYGSGRTIRCLMSIDPIDGEERRQAHRPVRDDRSVDWRKLAPGSVGNPAGLFTASRSSSS